MGTEDKIKGENGWDSYESSMSAEGVGTMLKIRIDFNRRLIKKWTSQFKHGMHNNIFTYYDMMDALQRWVNEATRIIVSGRKHLGDGKN